jgi:hypothetical protein
MLQGQLSGLETRPDTVSLTLLESLPLLLNLR